MEEQFSRTALLLGERSIEKLRNSTVAVFGIGGVGSYTVEALARSGIGKLVLCDGDTVAKSNLNRQLIALNSTVGKNKVDVAAQRIADINENAVVERHFTFFDSSTAAEFDFSKYDYVVDAIDTVTSKLLLVTLCRDAGTPIISCMGAGNKLDPTRFEVTDLFLTSVCPLARVMRRELRARGITSLKVVYSPEPAATPEQDENRDSRRPIPGSLPYVPAAAGLIAAGEVVKSLVNSSSDV